jgi:DNA polymerase/3'-5' exonuclease PolX
MSNNPKIPKAKAMQYAMRFIKLIEPHVIKSEIAGSIRREQPMVSDIEIVCLEDMNNPLKNLFHKGFKGMVKNGDRFKQFKYPEVSIDLFIAQPHDYGRILAIRTGSSVFSHLKLAVTWNRLGFAGTSDGLRRKKECEKKGTKWVLKEEYKDNPTLPPVFNTEVDFFDFLGIEWVAPKYRNWTSENNRINYAS